MRVAVFYLRIYQIGLLVSEWLRLTLRCVH